MLRMAELPCQFRTTYIWVDTEPIQGPCFGGVCAKPQILSTSSQILATVMIGRSVRLQLVSHLQQLNSNARNSFLDLPWAFLVLQMQDGVFPALMHMFLEVQGT